jgi:IS30 family transposase
VVDCQWKCKTIALSLAQGWNALSRAVARPLQNGSGAAADKHGPHSGAGDTVAAWPPAITKDNGYPCQRLSGRRADKESETMSERHYKQLRQKQREQIEEELNAKKGICEIAKDIGVSPATVTREIKRNRRDDGYRKSNTNSWGNGNLCSNRRSCEVRGLCGRCEDKKAKACSFCRYGRCMSRCGDYAEEICTRIKRSPHVCNGCPGGSTCRLHRFRYSAKDAQATSEARCHEAREGIDCSPEELAGTVDIIKAGLEKNQGLDHIFAAHKGELAFSKRSCYRHIENGAIDIISLELPKAVKYKQRGKSSREKPIDPKAMKGHTYADFLALDEEFRAKVVECDCVVGNAGSEDAVLTLHFKALHFQIGIKLARKDTAHVVGALDWLEEVLGGSFSRYLGILLFDRGSEFKDIVGMERGKNNKRRCAVYFTDAQRPDQKGSCEKNHVEFRKVVPKGTPLCEIDAAVLADVFSHVNSERRESLFGLCPMEMAKRALPKKLFAELGYRLIRPDDVDLRPSMIGLDPKTGHITHKPHE